MVETTYPRLCGGTFITLLLGARKDTGISRKHGKGGKNTHRNHDLVAGLININKPKNYEIPRKDSDNDKTFKAAASKYAACKTNHSVYLPFTDAGVAADLDDRLKNEDGYEIALNNTQTFIDDFIANGDERVELVKRLLDLIELDENIKPSDEFNMGYKKAVKKTDLCSPLKAEWIIHLPTFLLGIWHFIITKRQINTIGEDTIYVWYGKTDKEGEDKKDYKRGKNISPDKSRVEWNIKLIDEQIDIKSTACIESGDFTNNENDTQNDNFIETPVQCESPLKEFERVISEYQFSEFIKSEPLQRFTANSESEAKKLKLQYDKYVDRIRDDSISLFHSFDEYEWYFIENIQYTNKALTPALLTRSKQLVDVLTKKIFPAIEISRHPVRKNIYTFKEELESYNELLDKYLAVKNDSFVFDSEFNSLNADEDKNHAEEWPDCVFEVISKKLNFNIESVKIIPICEYEDEGVDEDVDIDTELNDIGSSYMAFHLATRIKRSKIDALYKEIQDEINPSSDA